MATKFKTLLKFQIKYKLGLSRIKDTFFNSTKSKISAIAGMIALLFVISLFLISYGFVMNLMYDFFASNNNKQGYFNAITLIANAIVLLTSVFSTYNIMFAEKDWEVLSPLPIKNNHIFLMNFIIMYLSSLTSSLAFLVPGFVVFFIKNSISIIMLFKVTIGILTFPILPLTISYLVISFVLRFFSKFKYKELLATLGGIFIICAYLLLNNNNQILNKLIHQADKISIYNKYVLNSYLFTQSLSQNGKLSLVYTLAAVLLAILLVVFVYFCGGKIYASIVEKSLNVSVNKNKVKFNFNQNAHSDAFCKKEIKTIIRSPIYVLNCLINIVLAPIAAYMLWKQKSSLSIILNDNINLFIITLVPCFIIMSTSMVASTTISREGKSFWLNQIIPISIKEQIKGRIKAAVIFYWISAFLYQILIGVLLKFDFLYIIYGLMLTFAGALPFAYSGLIIDISKPKLVWDKEAEAVKQNFNAVIGMVVCLVISLIYSIPVALYLTGVLSETVTMIMMPVVIVICIVITKNLLNKKGDYYEN